MLREEGEKYREILKREKMLKWRHISSIKRVIFVLMSSSF
jgi:hypothetical protein